MRPTLEELIKLRDNDFAKQVTDVVILFEDLIFELKELLPDNEIVKDLAFNLDGYAWAKYAQGDVEGYERGLDEQKEKLLDDKTRLQMFTLLKAKQKLKQQAKDCPELKKDNLLLVRKINSQLLDVFTLSLKLQANEYTEYIDII